MTPRKASLRVAHQRTCPLAMATTLESAAKGSGCKCQPSYYVITPDSKRPIGVVGFDG